jgi:ankyrin repeat protein
MSDTQINPSPAEQVAVVLNKPTAYKSRYDSRIDTYSSDDEELESANDTNYVPEKKILQPDDIIYNAFCHHVGNGNFEIVKRLYDNNNINLNACNGYVLGLSVQFDQYDIFIYLLNKKANFRINDDYALRCAATFGRIKFIKVLLDAGANIHAKEDESIRKSAEYGHLEAVKLLLGRKANWHVQNEYALEMSLKNGHNEVSNYILQWNATHIIPRT